MVHTNFAWSTISLRKCNCSLDLNYCVQSSWLVQSLVHSSVGPVLWFCYNLQFWAFGIFPLTCSSIPFRTTIPCIKHLFDFWKPLVRLCPMVTCFSSSLLAHSFFDCLGLTLHLRLYARMEFIYTLCTCNTLYDSPTFM